MSRGDESQPANHWSKGTECKIVFYEQSSHRDVSRANGEGYAKGRGGSRSWQSHHIVCVSAVAVRKAKDDPTTLLMEKSLYITEWNINKSPNMIGLPMYRKYTSIYGGIDKAKTKAARDAAFAAVSPQKLPAHDIDHNTDDGYTDEVTKYLDTNIWKKFQSTAKDHKKDAEWLAKRLTSASETFQGRLLKRGTRKKGTVAAWQNRLNDDDWAEPFSMADEPNQRFAGKSASDLTDIFNAL